MERVWNKKRVRKRELKKERWKMEQKGSEEEDRLLGPLGVIKSYNFNLRLIYKLHT